MKRRGDQVGPSSARAQVLKPLDPYSTSNFSPLLPLFPPPPLPLPLSGDARRWKLAAWLREHNRARYQKGLSSFKVGQTVQRVPEGRHGRRGPSRSRHAGQQPQSGLDGGTRRAGGGVLAESSAAGPIATEWPVCCHWTAALGRVSRNALIRRRRRSRRA